jgi:hypothetical protein
LVNNMDSINVNKGKPRMLNEYCQFFMDNSLCNVRSLDRKRTNIVG